MALPLVARFSFSARLAGIGTGTCVTFFWLRPLRDDGIINRGSGRSACKSATRRFAICDTLAPVTAAVSTNNPSSLPTPKAAVMMSPYHLIWKDDIARLCGVENGRQPNPPSGLIVDALVLSGSKIKSGAQRITDPVDR